MSQKRAAQINHSAQLTLDTYRQLLGVLESRLATDDVWEVLTEDDRDELDEWRIVFERRANEKGQT
jgi:hypothetical protein